MRNGASDFVPAQDLRFCRLPRNAGSQCLAYDRNGSIPSLFEISLPHGIFALPAFQPGAGKRRDLAFERGKAQDKEGLIEMSFLAFRGNESVVVVEIAGEIDATANVMRQTGIGAHQIFKIAVQCNFDNSQRGSNGSRSKGAPMGMRIQWAGPANGSDWSRSM